MSRASIINARSSTTEGLQFISLALLSQETRLARTLEKPFPDRAKLPLGARGCEELTVAAAELCGGFPLQEHVLIPRLLGLAADASL